MKTIVLFLMFGFAVLGFAGSKYEKWVKEDVKVLITDQEKETFSKLKTDEEKEQFITNFWTRRDPSPATSENEFRKEYEERFKSVDSRTNEGQTVLLLGEPDARKSDWRSAGGHLPHYSPADGMTVTYIDGREIRVAGSVGPHLGGSLRSEWIETFVYRNPPPEIASGVVRIDFVKGYWGELQFLNWKQAKKILEKARIYRLQPSGE